MRVLHVVATAQRRGAELFASSLVAALARVPVEQRVQVLRKVGWPEVPFDASVVPPAIRIPVPGVRLDAGAIASIHRTIAGFDPDIIQVHGGEALKHVLIATAGRGERVVYRRIGDAEQFARSRVRQAVYGALIRRSGRVVAVAAALRTELIERFGVDAARVLTIPNGVDAARLRVMRPPAEVRRTLGISRDARVVLSLGALTWEKDPLAQLRVMAHVAAARPDVVHVIAGDGPLRSVVETEVRRMDAAQRTQVLGSRDDVADLLSASDALLLASRTEGMPASAIEAGIAGVPVVAYALPGIAEVVVDGETGLLVPPGEEAPLVRALGELLDDGERRAALGMHAASWCRERFDIDAIARRYLDLYEQVVALTRERGVRIR